MVYKFNKQDNTFFYQDFDTLSDAENFIDGIEQIYIEQVPNFSKIPSSEKLQSDKSFLLFMMDRFVYINRQNSISPTESTELLTAFSSIKQLSEVGAVPEVRASIAGLVPPVGRVYTAERQADDLSKIDKYISIR